MKVSIAYAAEENAIWTSIDVAEGATIEDVINASGILNSFDINLKQQKVGIFGKLSKLNEKVCEGDRVEIYQAITRILDEDDDDDE